MLSAQLFFGLMAQAAHQVTGSSSFHISKNSMMAGSPFTSYDAAVALWVLLIGVLVAVMIIGGMLVISLGLLSKREEDRRGGRTPSDLGILKHSVWPEQPDARSYLPAEEGKNFIERLREEAPEGGETPKRAA